MLASVAVVSATVLAAVGLVPQVAKLIRTRIPDGVSVTWAAFGVVTNLAWTVYLTSQRLWLALPSVVLIVAAYLATVAILWRLGAPRRFTTILSAIWAGTLTLVGITLGWPGLGIVLGFSYAVQVAPGIWVAYRTARPDGIAPATWVIGFVEGMLWGYYGWWHADLPLMLFAVVAGVASIAMLARYATTRTRLPELAADAARP